MIRLAIKKPILTSVVFIIILIIGYISFTGLSIDLFPEIELSTITIITYYPGASSQDVEQQISKPIESALSLVSDVKNISSESRESVSLVEITFDWGKDLTEAVDDIRAQLDFSKRLLPEDAHDPIIMKFNSSKAPIVVIGVYSNTMSVQDLSVFSDKYILDEIRQVEGVGNVFASSSTQKKVNIKIRIPDMIEYNIPIEQIVKSIQAMNLDIPLGEIRQNQKTYNIRIPGKYKSIKDIEKTVIGNSFGNPIYLEDIADIEFGPGYMNSTTTIKGDEGLIIVVQKRSDANTVNLANDVKKKIEVLKSKYKDDIDMNVIFDSSIQIKNSINNLSRTLGYAFFFVILIVIIFLGNIRSSIVIALAIPFSLILAFIYLYASGNSINIISLASLSIAIGMVVDNSIVVLENIFRHRDKEGEEIDIAAARGTKEVIMPIFASTLTTIAIFVPLLFVQGFTAIFFKQLAFTVSIVLLGSLFTSTTLTPMLSALLLKNKKKEENKKQKGFQLWFSKLENRYSSFLMFSLKHKKFIIVSVLIIFLLSISILPSLKTEFMPAEQSGVIFGTIKLIPGTRIEITDSIITTINQYIKENIKELSIYSLSAGSETTGGSFFSEKNQYSITFIGSLVPQNQRELTEKQILNKIRKKLSTYPEIKYVDFTKGGPQAVLGGAKQISLNIAGDNIDSIYKVAKYIENELKQIDGFVDISISRDESLDNISIIPDKAAMSLSGLNTFFLMNSLRTGLYGKKVSIYRKDGFEYDIIVLFDKKYLNSINDLYNLPIHTPYGKIIPLSSVVDIKYTKEPPLIERENQQRIVKVEANLQNLALSEATIQTNKIINSMHLPYNIKITHGGEAKEQKQSFKELMFAILIGIVLVFLVMAGQFESFIDPFIIMFSLPFAFTGVIWALFLTGTPLSIMGFIGMLILVGIVVNNAIVLIDYINKLREKGISLNEAIPLAGKTRLKPVLMTALTTIFGLLPLALSSGQGSAIWKPLGVVVVGGLTLSTMVTLIIIPVLYSIFEAKIKRKAY